MYNSISVLYEMILAHIWAIRLIADKEANQPPRPMELGTVEEKKEVKLVTISTKRSLVQIFGSGAISTRVHLW